MQIRPGGDVQHYLNRLREGTDPADLRTSPRRADHLSRVGAILAMDEVRVRLDPEQPTATIETRRAGRGDPGRWDITITGDALPQPVTGYGREAYDMLVQETLLVHEIGHVLYTDYEAFRDVCQEIEPEHRSGFRALFNAAEDVAVEAQLRARFSVAEELDILNANLFDAAKLDGREYTILQAVELAILELGVWQIGVLSSILDDDNEAGRTRTARLGSRADERVFRDKVFPLVRELVKTLKTTADGARRVGHVKAFWEVLVEVLEEADAGGLANEGEPAGPSPVKPDDADPERRGESQRAEALEDNDGSDVDERADEALGIAAGDEDHEQARADDANSPSEPERGPRDADEESSGETPDDSELEGAVTVDLADADRPPGDDTDGTSQDGTGSAASGDRDDDGHGTASERGLTTDAALEDEYAQEAGTDARSAARNEESLAEELEAFMAALDGASDEFAGVQLDVPVPEGGRYDEDAFGYARRVSQWIAQELGDRLRQEKRQRPLRRRSTGGLDPKRMTAADRGDHRIFQRTRAGGEKDYHAMFVADRSSSMGGPKIRMLERSIGGMAMGLEEIGVRTAVMDLYRDEARLVKPFGIPVESRRSLMFSQDTGGSTPLRKVVAVARERLDAEGGNRFLVIVTDGQVGETEAFKEQVDRCNFPVLGIYLAPGYGGLAELTYFNSKFDYEGQLALFHRYRTVFDQNGLNRTLSELCKEVMF